MKHLRLFPNEQVRDSVLADINYPVLHSTDGVGIGVKPGSVVPPTPSTSTPFYVENITQQNETLTIGGYDSGDSGYYLEIQVEKSTDGTTWTSFGTTGSTPLTQTLAPGDKLYLRASTDNWSSTYKQGKFMTYNYGCSIYGVSKIGGNIMSLLYGSSFTGNETTFPVNSIKPFNYLFTNGATIPDVIENNKLINAALLILPVTTLIENCYNGMFARCISLTTPPTLPATTLARGCYGNMFNGCASLTAAPELPATTLVDTCYSMMFGGCTSLNSITIYANDISATNPTHSWVSNVAQNGTFHNLGSATYERGINGIPSGWTEVHS